MAKKKKNIATRTGHETKAGFVSAELKTPDIQTTLSSSCGTRVQSRSPASQVRRARRGGVAGGDAEQRAREIRHSSAPVALRLAGIDGQGASRCRRHAADRTGPEEVREEGHGHGVHPERLRPGRAQESQRCPENRARAEQKGPGVEGLCRPAARPSRGRERFAGRQPQLRAVARLPARRAERHRRDRGRGASVAPRAPV